jgi:hypothetical protein
MFAKMWFPSALMWVTLVDWEQKEITVFEKLLGLFDLPLPGGRGCMHI